MKITTRKFGEIEIDEQDVLSMPQGLAGFADYKKFVLIQDPETDPLCWFQSVEEPNLSLVVMDPFIFKKDYTIDGDSVIREMKWENTSEEDLLVYVVVNIFASSAQNQEGNEKEGNRKITANLAGPLVINSNNHEAIQVVLPNPDYSCQHEIM